MVVHRTRGSLRVCAASVLLAALCLSGCSSKQIGTTRLTVSDIEYTSTELTAQLSSAPFLLSRDAASDEIFIMPGTFRNISSERIGEADRWAMVTRMLYDPSIHELLRSKNASVVMPRDRQSLFQRYAIATVADEPDSDPDLLTADAPSLRFEAGSLATHRLDTTFLSASRSATDSDEDAVERKDLFIVQTELVEVASGRAVWSGSSEFARVARGLILD